MGLCLQREENCDTKSTKPLAGTQADWFMQEQKCISNEGKSRGRLPPAPNSRAKYLRILPVQPLALVRARYSEFAD